MLKENIFFQMNFAGNMDLTSKFKRDSLDFLRGSAWLAILYFGQKFLYLFVTLSQILALNRLLAANDSTGFHGIEVFFSLKWPEN